MRPIDADKIVNFECTLDSGEKYLLLPVAHLSDIPTIPIKPFFFTMSETHHRTGAAIGKRVGVVFASDKASAEQIAWDKYGGDACCALDIWEIEENSASFTVWRGSFT